MKEKFLGTVKLMEIMDTRKVSKNKRKRWGKPSSCCIYRWSKNSHFKGK